MRTLLAASGEGHRATAQTPRHGTTFSKSWKNAMAADRPYHQPIRRLGSSTTACPRRRSSASSVDLPPPEHPELLTNRSTESPPGPTPIMGALFFWDKSARSDEPHLAPSTRTTP